MMNDQTACPRTPRSLLCVPLLAVLVLGGCGIMGSSPPKGGTGEDIEAAHGLVVSDSRLASEIGREVLEAGGTAVDAAVAAAFVLAVTWPEAGNLAGGGFMLVVGPEEAPVCVDFRETAPAAATTDLLAGDAGMLHARAAGVPGSIRGLARAHARFGRVAFGELLAPAIRLAEEGFPVDAHLAASLNHALEDGTTPEALRPAFEAEFARPAGGPWREGDRMRRPDLARTLRILARDGADAFYRGPLAEAMVSEVAAHGGILTEADLDGYEVRFRAPVEGTYRGYRILSAPPPASGGICLVLMLNILERFELNRMDRFGAPALHLMAEAMRRGFRDRAVHLGDPDFVPIPDHLTTKRYASTLARDIEPTGATPSRLPGGDPEEERSTTHVSVADRFGIAVSLTTTLEASFGSRLVIPGTGILLNNEMGDFNRVPGSTTEAGAIGTPPNVIAPGKRMLSSQCPTIVTRDTRPFLITGSPGGRSIISTVLGVLVSVIDHDMDLREAVAAPRIHHGWFPDRLELEGADLPERAALVEALEALGHDVVPVRGFRGQGSANTIRIDPHTQVRRGVGDPRRGGSASGY